MNRHQLAVTAVSVFLFLGLLLRPVLLRMKTGKWGFNGISGAPGSAGWWGGVSFFIALLVVPLALSLEASPIPEVFTPLALLLLGSGLTITLLAQSGMGASWRIGVDASERTALVTSGLFRFVRNPIFAGIALLALGLLILWPNAASFASLALLVIGVELQVRFVEEPYLKTVHGGAWLRWAQRVGRFVPYVGRE